MKRAFPQKVKPVTTQVIGYAETTGQSKQAPQEVNRRACTSAAVLGLAISMGASSLLVPQQNDGAVASEPVMAEPSLVDAPSSVPASVTESAVTQFPAPELIVVEHMVQEGQTLSYIARFYRSELAAIAAFNGIAPNSVLQVGQVIKVPTESVGNDVGQPKVTASSEPIYTAFAESANSAVSSNQSSVVLSTTPDNLKAKMPTVVVKPQVGTTTPTSPDFRVSLVGKSDSGFGSPSLNTQPTATTSSPLAAVSPKLVNPASGVVHSEELEIVNPDAQQPVENKRVVPAPTQASDFYQVKRGDTLAAIARTYGISVDELSSLNRLEDPNFLLVNQRIKVPSRSASVVDRQSAQLSQVETVQPVEVATTSVNIPVISASTSKSVPSEDDSSNDGADESAEAVAVAPLSGRTFSQPGDKDSSNQLNSEAYYSPYAAALRLEIVQLREKYRQADAGSASGEQVQAPVAVESLREKPALNQMVSQVPHSGSAKENSDELAVLQPIEGVQIGTSSRPKGVTPAEVASPNSPATLYATAPLGADRYAPIVESLVGQTVSPDLPPLGSEDRYLPSPTQQADGYIWPTKGVLTSGYGWRWGRMHKGIDIAGPVGTPIVAAAPGVVVTAGWNSGGYGNLVEIRHSDGSLTLYAHNSRILVRPGQQVEQGELISEMGSTGYSTGPHLHFEVHPAGKGAVNPIAFLPRR